MEIILSTDQLRTEMRAFAGLVEKGATLEVMSNLLIETGNGKLFLTGSDGDVTLRSELGPDFYESVSDGATCIKADKLSGMLGTLDSSVKSIRLKKEDNGWNTIKFGKSKFRVSGIEAGIYPRVKTERDPGSSPVMFPAGLLLQFLNSTSHAVSLQDTKFTISGANLKVTGGHAQMDATDGFKIASINSKLDGEFSALFPRKVSSALKRALSESSPEVLVELTSEPNFIFARIGNKSFAFRRMVGEFPDISKIMGIENDHEATLDLYPLQSAIRRADLFSEKQNHSGVSLTFRPGELEVHSKSFEVGSGNEVLSIEYSGPETTVKLNAGNLMGFFSSINETEDTFKDVKIRVAFSQEETKATIWSVAKDASLESVYDYKCLITKLRN